MSDRRRRSAVLFACMTLLATACGAGEEATRVGVDRDSTNVVFGADSTTTTVKVAAPPGVVGPADGPSATSAVDPGEEVDLTPTTKPLKRITQPGGSAAVGPCPVADVDAPVERSAGISLDGRPRVGTYRWNARGTYRLATANIPLMPAFEHVVRNVQTAQDTSVHVAGVGPTEVFGFQTLDPRINGGFTAFSWVVKGNSSDPLDTEAGLVLKQIDVLNQAGKPQSTYFKASGNGLLWFPLSVKPGTSWTSIALDPAHGPITLRGQVLDRQTFDACGKVVEGWRTAITLNDGDASAAIEVLVAPQYGGQIIATSISGTYLGVAYDKAVMRLGQIEPSPLPKAFA
jgi:hypothetical protein